MRSSDTRRGLYGVPAGISTHPHPLPACWPACSLRCVVDRRSWSPKLINFLHVSRVLSLSLALSQLHRMVAKWQFRCRISQTWHNWIWTYIGNVVRLFQIHTRIVAVLKAVYSSSTTRMPCCRKETAWCRVLSILWKIKDERLGLDLASWAWWTQIQPSSSHFG